MVINSQYRKHFLHRLIQISKLSPWFGMLRKQQKLLYANVKRINLTNIISNYSRSVMLGRLSKAYCKPCGTDQLLKKCKVFISITHSNTELSLGVDEILLFVQISYGNFLLTAILLFIYYCFIIKSTRFYKTSDNMAPRNKTVVFRRVRSDK